MGNGKPEWRWLARLFLWARQELPYLTYCLDTGKGIGIIDTAYQETNQLQINPFLITYQ